MRAEFQEQMEQDFADLNDEYQAMTAFGDTALGRALGCGFLILCFGVCLCTWMSQIPS